MKLTTHLQLEPRSRKRGSADPLLHISSWRSAYFVQHKDGFTFSTHHRHDKKWLAFSGEQFDQKDERGVASQGAPAGQLKINRQQLQVKLQPAVR
jgi:hypothetical protein